jgi:hypothetical protein
MAVLATTNDPTAAALAELAERQARLDAAIEALADQLADQALRAEQQDEQLRVQASALSATAAQLSRSISEGLKNANGGEPANSAAKANGKGNPGNPGGGANPSPAKRIAIAGARAGGAVNVGPIEGEAEIGGGFTTPPGSKSGGKAEKPEEPKEATKKKAHRWI